MKWGGFMMGVTTPHGCRWARILAILIAAFLLSLVFAAPALPATQYRAKWSQGSVSPTVRQGQRCTAVVSVNSTAPLKNVIYQVRGALRSFVRVSPPISKLLKPGKKTRVTLSVSPSAKQASGIYHGTLVAVVGKKAASAALRITVVVAQRPAKFTPRAQSQVVSAIVGTDGGTVAVPVGPSPVGGVSITFPAGALPHSVNVTLGYDRGSLTPGKGTYAGFALTLDTGDAEQFDQPVTITVPFTDPRKVPVPYYVDSSGSLELAQLVSIDANAHTFTFQTFHASWYTWIYTPMDWLGIGDHETGYAPRADGFQIVNTGSDFNRGGECLGMTSFSLWYFMHAKSNGNLYPRFMEQYGTDSFGRSIKGQNIIATRAFTSIAQQWNTYYDTITQQTALSEDARYLVIANAIQTTGAPVLIHLGHSSSPNGGGHSVLAYAFNDLTKRISVYNPNEPGQSPSMYFDAGNHKFKPYDGYDIITFCGDGSLHLSEPYQNILDDAQAGFHGNRTAQVNVGSPSSGSHVADRSVAITGTIESGQVLVAKLTVLVGSTAFSTNVGQDGSFSLTVNLVRGENHLTFATYGPDADGKLTAVSNNLGSQDYVITLDAAQSIMLVTLTWDTNDSDVDLYVTDPLGYTSWFADKVTPSGGTLDYDITTGYGPEHWTLLRTDQIQWNQPYIIRLHYYSDHSNGPTNYTVSVMLNEDTPRQSQYFYRGNLSANDPSNREPGSTGDDWVDIASPVLQP
jgi:uncharacterized protein YfaP (DUF2135 family)